MYHEIGNMLRLRRNVEAIGLSLCQALQEYPVEDYFSKDESDKRTVFSQQMKSVFQNSIKYFDRYKKHVTTEDIYGLKESQNSPIERLKLLKEIQGNAIAKIITYILKNHVYVGVDEVDKSLQHLMEIHGEDIDRPLL